MTKKLLITGFEPFGGDIINPSWEAVKRLYDVIGGYEITKLELPCVFGKAGSILLEAAEELCPDVIICTGQAGGRTGITPEAVAINLRAARIEDNEGNKPENEPVIIGADDGYFATLPIREMTSAIINAGIPAHVSYTAGTFVCNDVLFTLLHKYRGTTVKAGFIHVPYLKEQAGEKEFGMELETICDGLTAAISVI